jgi:hypothetical protein
MSRLPPALRGFAIRLPSLVIAGLAMAAASSATPALAQAGSCQDITVMLKERQTLIQRIAAMGAKGKKVDARVACTSFTTLVANGTKSVKWMEANKDWCQVPDALIENIRNDHGQAQKLRANACKVAAQVADMEKKAKSGGQTGLLGGEGLTGSYKIPQGAM